VEDPEGLAAFFRSRGLKVTPQRQAIFASLHRAPGHATAEGVYRDVRPAVPTISLKTVYETLHCLAGLGQLRLLELGTGSMLFDSRLTPHGHLICRVCDDTVDVEVVGTEAWVPGAGPLGFAVSHVEVIARGLCASCRDHAPPTGA